MGEKTLHDLFLLKIMNQELCSDECCHHAAEAGEGAVSEDFPRPDNALSVGALPAAQHALQQRLCQQLATCHNDGRLLSSDVTHYMIPDWKVVQDYFEILEFPELKGIIFMQTAYQTVHH